LTNATSAHSSDELSFVSLVFVIWTSRFWISGWDKWYWVEQEILRLDVTGRILAAGRLRKLVKRTDVPHPVLRADIVEL
jgi:hypothetical protein